MKAENKNNKKFTPKDIRSYESEVEKEVFNNDSDAEEKIKKIIEISGDEDIKNIVEEKNTKKRKKGTNKTKGKSKPRKQ